MKFGVVNKSTNVTRFVLHTLLRNITHLAVITRKTNIKLGILKGGWGTGKELVDQIDFPSSPKAVNSPCFGHIFSAAGKFLKKKNRSKKLFLGTFW